MGAASLWVLRQHTDGPFTLNDTDTSVLLATLKAHPEPFRWFLGDWPLGNHFYRPISTLFFQIDNAYSHANPVGFGWTNCFLVLAAVWALFWFARELTDDRFLTCASVFLFLTWIVYAPPEVGNWLRYVPYACLFGGIWRHRLDWRRWLGPYLISVFACASTYPMVTSLQQAFAWIPARTATSMTVFALAALAAYARSMRLTVRKSPEASPLDPPATKSSRIAAEAKPAKAWPWDIVAFVCGALALGSYEQAVMLTPLFIVVAFAFRWRGYLVRWTPVLVQFLILVGYVLLRTSIVPTSVSGYQHQQFRHGPAVWFTFTDFLAPALGNLPSLYSTVTMGVEALLLPPIYEFVFAVATNVATAIRVANRWTLALPAYLLGPIAFGPMAFLKRFPHYYFFPLCFYAIFVAILLVSAFEALVSAWSPPERQAPRRRHPAPGSLPRP